MQIKEKSLGPDNPELAANHNNLGKILVQQGRLPEALVELHRALQILEKSAQPIRKISSWPTPPSGSRSGVKGTWTMRWARPGALALELETLGPDHDLVADAHANIANILFEQGKVEDALGELRRATAIHAKALGPENPRVAIDHSNLGSMLTAQNRTEEAAAEARQALAIQEKALGPDHPDTAITEGNIGELELKQRSYKQAVNTSATRSRSSRRGLPIR